jgi:esterase/lipase superfamily enzyme
MALGPRGIPAKIDNVVLASPDLDVDVFRRQLDEIGPRRPEITVFTSAQDRALGVSSLIAGRVTRLGGIDLASEDYRQKFAGQPKLTFIDLSELKGSDMFNHTTFATSPQAVRLIGERLLAGQSVTDSDAVSPLGGTAQTLGTAAGTLVAAPFLILQGVQPQ